MRKFIMAAALAAPLTFGGCANMDATQITAQIQAFAQQVQQIAQSTCQFLPTVGTVADIIAAAAAGPGGAAAVASANAVASQICAAIVPKAGKLRAESPHLVINGKVVPIHGTYLSGR